DLDGTRGLRRAHAADARDRAGFPVLRRGPAFAEKAKPGANHKEVPETAACAPISFGGLREMPMRCHDSLPLLRVIQMLITDRNSRRRHPGQSILAGYFNRIRAYRFPRRLHHPR